MTEGLPNHLTALLPLLDEVLDLDGERRAVWLAELRRTRPDEATEIEALLDLEDGLDAIGFLRPAAGGPVAGGLAGRRLDNWTLERHLGQGGMGTVWLARRNDGRYEGTAAVKLLHLALLDPVGAERFRREGTVLARLSHPNIARLLDAGVTEDGQPYLVLEHVEGERIDRYCDARRLPPDARLRLFLDVLAAVAHAHANLVVHRDLKPSNILVTGDGQVKLLDFGIAKLLGEGRADAEATTLTDAGGRALTPEYAAPEQVAGGAVTTATDVYALGVLLYVLLAGRHPTGDGNRAPAEYLQRLLDTEPARLSSAVAHPELRAASAERLRRAFAGDLDNIVAKALRKAPPARYATVAALADDLRRHLAHLPVAARAESWTYRTAKFVRRHRVGVATAATTVLALLGATGFSLVQLGEARRQRDAAIGESRRRVAMADVQGVLAGDARGAGGRTLSVRERIDLAERVLRRRYRAEPSVVVEVLADLAGRLVDINDLEGYDQVLRRALALAQQADLPAHRALVNCLRAVGFTHQDRLDSAAALLGEARASAALAGELRPLLEVPCLDAQGRVLFASGQPDSAIRVLQAAVSLAPDPHGQLALASRNNLASALRAAGRTREAARYHEDILRELDSAGYDDTEILASLVSYLAGALAELGEFRTLDSVLHAFALRHEAVHGPGAVRGVLAAVHGVNKLRMGEVDSAAVWLAVAGRDTSEGARQVTALWLPYANAQLLVERGEVAEARKALAALATDSPGRRATVALLRARLRRLAGDPAGGNAEVDRFLAAEGAPAPPQLYVMLAAAEWAWDDGDAVRADSLARRALAVAALDSLAAVRSGHVGRAELVRARVAAGGDTAVARTLAGRAARTLSQGFGPAHRLSTAARALNDSLAP